MNAEYFIKNLNLIKLPNNMYLAETYLSEDYTQSSEQKQRKASSAAQCLYQSGVFAGFHSLQSEETLILNYGCSLEVITINEDGSIKKEVLGYDLEKGEKPQITIPKNKLFAIVNSHTDPNAFSLATAFVTPAYDVSFCSFPKGEELIEKFPQHKELIQKYASN